MELFVGFVIGLVAGYFAGTFIRDLEIRQLIAELDETLAKLGDPPK
jgi:NhaP-type Na+/H+ or K+/H+ antiporter